MKVIAIIPARSGSKGFPNKNLSKINDKTLIELAVKVGLDCETIEDVYISTDSKFYEGIALDAGAKSLGLRSASLATDTAKTADVIVDLLNQLETTYDYVVLLQPTSPMRTPKDITQMLRRLEDSGADTIVSVEKIDEPHPHKLKEISENGFIKPFVQDTNSEIPRQLLPDVYKLNGAIYISKYDTMLDKRQFFTEKTLPFYMHPSINIDSEFDYHVILGLLALKKIKIYGA